MITPPTFTPEQWQALAAAVADAIDYRINDAEAADADSDAASAEASRQAVCDYDAVLAILNTHVAALVRAAR